MLEAIITNVFLCPDADCAHETPRAIADFSRRVSLEPGEQTLYKFDVELHGKAQRLGKFDDGGPALHPNNFGEQLCVLFFKSFDQMFFPWSGISAAFLLQPLLL